jgi:hypothetical protein
VVTWSLINCGSELESISLGFETYFIALGWAGAFGVYIFINPDEYIHVHCWGLCRLGLRLSMTIFQVDGLATFGV